MTTLSAANSADRATLKKILGVTNTTRRRPNKYKSKITYIDNHRFHSQKEARRYVELKLEQDAGNITDLELQPRYELRAWPQHVEMGPVKLCTYVADFRYVRDGNLIIEDVKGMRTAMYILKKKLMKANYNIEVLET